MGSGGWDLRAIEAEHPEVAAQRGHRLADLSPHFWIAGGELLQFACRWSSQAPVAVWTVDARPGERALLDRALATIANAVPGLAFERSAGAPGGLGISVRFLDVAIEEGGAAATVDSGHVVADCRIDAPLAGPSVGNRLPGQLANASVRIWRSRLDLLGRSVPLEESELFASMLHEMGHAVGYGSHVRRGPGVMLSAPSEVRLRALPALRGEPLREPTLAALYALPSGEILRRDPAPPEAQATARVFAELARAEGLPQPLSRAGVASAELWWPYPDGGRRILRATRGAGPWPGRFGLVANARARDWLRARMPGAFNPPSDRAGEPELRVARRR